MYNITIWKSPDQKNGTLSISVIYDPQNGGQKEGVLICTDMQSRDVHKHCDFYKKLDSRTTVIHYE